MLFFLPCKYVLTTHSVLHHQDYKRAYERFSDGLEMDPENAEMEMPKGIQSSYGYT
jgi:lipoprotein NlpI